MERDQIQCRLREIFADLFAVDRECLVSDSSPDSIPNWDSLQHLNLISAVEEEFGITLSEEQVVEMLSFGLVVEIVAGIPTAR